jgi:hypothetical protein
MPTLNEARIRASKPQEKPYKVFDKRGLFLLITPSGGRLWRMRYRFAGVERLLTLGAYPDGRGKSARMLGGSLLMAKTPMRSSSVRDAPR